MNCTATLGPLCCSLEAGHSAAAVGHPLQPQNLFRHDPADIAVVILRSPHRSGTGLAFIETRLTARDHLVYRRFAPAGGRCIT